MRRILRVGRAILVRAKGGFGRVSYIEYFAIKCRQADPINCHCELHFLMLRESAVFDLAQLKEVNNCDGTDGRVGSASCEAAFG